MRKFKSRGLVWTESNLSAYLVELQLILVSFLKKLILVRLIFERSDSLTENNYI